MPIKNYRNGATRDIAEGVESKAAVKLLAKRLHGNARMKLAALNFATSLNDLLAFRGWRLEQLKGERAGQFSIRINDQFRICFTWEKGNCSDVEITDYH